MDVGVGARHGAHKYRALVGVSNTGCYRLVHAGGRNAHDEHRRITDVGCNRRIRYSGIAYRYCRFHRMVRADDPSYSGVDSLWHAWWCATAFRNGSLWCAQHATRTRIADVRGIYPRATIPHPLRRGSHAYRRRGIRRLRRVVACGGTDATAHNPRVHHADLFVGCDPWHCAAFVYCHDDVPEYARCCRDPRLWL